MGDQKVALVAGGSGGIGEGIVAALMKANYLVYVPTRPGDQSERLKAYVAEMGTLRTVPADLCREDEVRAMRDQIMKEEGRVDSVIVSVGSYYYGHRLHRMPGDDWERTMQDNLTTHFNLQRAFIDQMRRQEQGVYVVLTGPEAESIHPDEGIMSIMASAQRMMARVTAYEAFDSPVRVYTVTAHTSIKTRSRGVDTNPDWITAAELGDYVASLVAGTLPGAHEVVHELRNHDHVGAMLGRG